MIDYPALRKTVQDAVTRKHESMVVATPGNPQACSNHVLERFVERSPYERPTQGQVRNTADLSAVPIGAYFTVLACVQCRYKRRIDYTLGLGYDHDATSEQL